MPTFPALDEEPPPRSLWRRSVIPVVVLLVIAAAIFAGFTLSGGEGSDANIALATPGAVNGGVSADGTLLATNDDETLVTVDPFATGEARTVPGPVSVYSGVVTMAPDGRHVATGDGDVAPVNDGRLGSFDAVSPAGLEGQVFPAVRPWADRGAALLYIGAGGGSAEQVVLHDLGTDRDVRLGTGTDAFADPSGPAAVVITTHDTQQRVDGFGGNSWATSTVEWRATGHRTTLLTVEQFADALHLSRHRYYRLSAAVSPNGKLVAVYGDDFHGNVFQHGGLVIVTTSGRVVHAYPQASIGDLAWSPDSKTVAATLVVANSVFNTELLLYRAGTKGRPPVVNTSAGSTFGRPIWSQDGRHIIVSPGVGWFYVDAQSGNARSVDSGFVPLAWLPAPQSAR